MMIRKTLATAAAVLAVAGAPASLAQDASTFADVEPGDVLLFRHATAPGTGDPPGFRLGDCSTQRNLDDQGRTEARAIGDAIRAAGIEVGAVLSSQWCRARDTADLAFPGMAIDEPAFNSFFDDRAAEAGQTAAAQAIIEGWDGPGVAIVFTHQVNIRSLSGLSVGSGEGAHLDRDSGQWEAIGLPGAE